MKKTLFFILTMFFCVKSFAQSDYTGKIIHFSGSYTDPAPGGKLFVVDGREDSLYLPDPATAVNKMFIIKPQNLMGYARLNRNVIYTPDGLPRSSISAAVTSSYRNYIYSDGTTWKWAPSIAYVDSVTFLPMARAMDADTNLTIQAKIYSYKVVAADYGTMLDFSTTSSSEKLNLPNPATLQPISFKIVNHGRRPVQLNYQIVVEGQVYPNQSQYSYQTSLSHTEGGNCFEIVPDGSVYRVISH